MRDVFGGAGRVASLAALFAIVAVIGACGTTDDSSGGSDEDSASGSGSGTVGLLLPESKTSRYEQFDRPLFEQNLEELCPDCELLYANADQDAAQQQSQAESMLTKGADVLVLDPVDGEAAEAIVNKAKGEGVGIVSYDRLASGPIDYYVSFDNERVGELQGEALLEALGDTADDGKVVMINGSPTDPNAAQFKKGAHSALDGEVDIDPEYDTPDWSPDKAQQEMEQAITSVGAENIVGVYSANDGMAGGIIAALKGANVDPLPPVTGQDAELDGIQRVVSGDQTMTVYKAIAPEAQTAAEMAMALLSDEEYADATDTVSSPSGDDVPATLLDPVAVTQDNIEDTVVADDFYTVKEICAGQFAQGCAEIGLEQ